MQETNAPGDTESVHVRNRSIAPPNIKNTNSFADVARVPDRVQTSGCNRRTRLLILDRILYALAL
eukprot:1901820-Pyramimonas_sp.AAC.1